MVILNKSKGFPLTTDTAQKEGASAHKFNKASGNLPFPCTGAHTDPQNSCQNPRERSAESPDTGTSCYKQVFICHANPRVGKSRLKKATALRKGKIRKIQSWGKPLTSRLHSNIRHLLSEVKREIDAVVTSLAD